MILSCATAELTKQIGSGIASLRPIAESRQALKNVGFEILVDEDLAERESILPSLIPACVRY